MKRFALFLAAVGTLFLGAGAAGTVSAYPFGLVSSLRALDTQGLPNYEVPVVVSNCFPDELVVFTLGDSTADSTCSDVSFEARATLRAPAAVGSYDVEAELRGTQGPVDPDRPDESRIERPRTLTAQISVVAQAPDTTVAAVPISGEIPTTGSSGIGSTTLLALGLSVVGLGLLVVSQVRRRGASA